MLRRHRCKTQRRKSTKGSPAQHDPKDSPFIPFEHVSSAFERVLAASPADETELVWFERRYSTASSHGERADIPTVASQGRAGAKGGKRDSIGQPRLTVLIRVIERGRQGWHRTDSPRASELEAGLRQALALAKVQPRVKKRPVLPTDKRAVRFLPKLLDTRVSDLDLPGARSLLSDWCGRDLRGRLDWSETRLAIFNSHGLRRSAATSELTFEAACDGGGRAGGSARTLKALDAQSICRRARRCRGRGAASGLPSGPVPILLAPEVTVTLLNVLNTFALAGRTYLDGTSFLVRHRNVQVFDHAFHLLDDGHREPGVPFPFDLEGSPKRPLELIAGGQPSTVALSQYQGAEAGMRPTAQAVGGTDALFGNLFLLPGDTSDDDLLAAADGGIHIGWIDPPECLEPSQLRIRTIARCVHRIENGRLGAALPDFCWEESLLRAFARLRATGRQLVVHSTPTTPLGAITAPAVVLADAGGFQPRS